MDITGLKIGTKIEFELVTDSDTLKSATYISQLVEIVDAHNIVIAAPIANSRVVFIPPGFKINVSLFYHQHGLIGFTGTVLSRGTLDNLSVLNIKVDTELEIIQRRRYFRLSCILNAKYRICVEKENEENEEPAPETASEYKDTLIKNISGSGACIVNDVELASMTVIELKIKLDPNSEVYLKAQVIRCIRLAESGKEKYEIGLLFVEMSDNVQRSIIKYIFDQQRIMIQKGLLDK